MNVDHLVCQQVAYSQMFITTSQGNHSHNQTFSKPIATDSLISLTTGSHIPVSNPSCFLLIKDPPAYFSFNLDINTFFSQKYHIASVVTKFTAHVSPFWKTMVLPVWDEDCSEFLISFTGFLRASLFQPHISLRLGFLHNIYFNQTADYNRLTAEASMRSLLSPIKPHIKETYKNVKQC